jgi:cell division protein FtsB
VTRPFRVIALISTFNEGDIIAAVIRHLVDNGIDVYLIDNHSTDDTVEQAEPWIGRGLLHIEYLPARSDAPSDGPLYDWTAILRRKEQLAQELEADWFIHHDADEVREGPFPRLGLRDTIEWIDARGYNAIDHIVLNFRPVDDDFRQGEDPRTYFQYYEEAAEYDRTQIKAWKKTGAPVSLMASGGHHAEFEGRRVFPLPFLIRHYPVRGQTHGLNKVFAERKARFVEAERVRGWHVQYDSIADQAHVFTRKPSELQRFDLEQIRLAWLLSDEARQSGARADAAIELLRQERLHLQRRLEEHRVHVENLQAEHTALIQHAANLQDELDGVRAHAANLEREITPLRPYARRLEQEQIALRAHAEALEQERTALRAHAEALEQERAALPAPGAALEEQGPLRDDEREARGAGRRDGAPGPLVTNDCELLREPDAGGPSSGPWVSWLRRVAAMLRP